MTAGIVTVFGASGFLGRHTVRALAKAGWRVRAAERNPENAQFLKPMGMVGQVALLRADVTDAGSVARAVAGSDAVINLVGTMAGGFCGNRFTAVHVGGARNVAEAAKAAGVGHLVQVSAIGADAASGSTYARSKGEGEAAVSAAFPDAVIVRPSILFGPEDQFFNRFANMSRYSLVLPLIGGATRFQPAYVGDVAAALVKALDHRGQTFQLGGPDVMSFRQIMEMVLRMVARRRLLLPLPFGVATVMAYPLSILPGAPLTPDQVKLLKLDNIVAAGAKGFADLDIQPQAAEAIVPTYLWRFRRTGQFETAAR